MGRGAMSEAARTGTVTRRLAGALLAGTACLGLAGCAVPRALNPAEIWREVSGANDAARPTPPGLDQPFPSLGTVPPRPDRPSPEAREAISAGLAADRSRSRDPLVLRSVPGSGGGAVPTGPGLSGGPPPRPSLAGAPNVPWAGTPTPPSTARGGGTPAGSTAAPTAARPPTARPVTPVPEMPDAPPAPPAPDLLGGPPPLPDLSAPPPPARR